MKVFYRTMMVQGIERFVKSRGWHFLALIGTLIATSPGCGTEPSEPPTPPQPPQPRLTTVDVSPASVTLNSFGETTTLAATGRDQNNSTMSVSFSWSTDNRDVATVNGSGVVTATGNGSTQVTATSGGVSGNATVVVDQQPVVLEILTQPADAFEGVAFDFPPIVELQDANAHRVSDDNSTEITAALQDNPSGASLIGTTTVTAVLGIVEFDDLAVNLIGDGYSLSFTGGALAATVSAPFDVLAVPAAINVMPNDLNFSAFGEQQSLSATALDGGGQEIDGVSFVWTSTHPDIADVNESGAVEAIENGTAQVTASAGGVTSAPVGVVVQQVATSMTVTPELSIVAAGATAGITVEAFDSRGNAIAAPQLTATVANGNVLTVNGTTLTGVAAGQTGYTVNSGTANAEGRAVVVESDGFAAIITTDRSDATVVAQAGSELVVQLMLLRPSGGTGSLASTQGRLEWDEAHLELTGTEIKSEALADGFSWFPNDAEASQGVFRFSAFSPTGNEAVGVDVTIAELTFSVTGAAGSESVLDLVIDVVGSTGGDTVTDKVQVVDTDLRIVS